MAGESSAQLFAAFVGASHQHICYSATQELANTAFAFATVNHGDDKLFALLARWAYQLADYFNFPSIQMALWASSQREHVLVSWSHAFHSDSDFCRYAVRCGDSLLEDEGKPSQMNRRAKSHWGKGWQVQQAAKGPT